ncbi:response regulator transcription factor [Hymenobacter aquaticus]|uniref:Response regulator transcription factor n=1 Tax=Hymenobacter aquaticus TaxID=1867101 RepID=A0A4Z0PUA9_9BACT|nr:response regulator transcription factor [Hymenobacter aquaticus]TGE21370.1 response regulator transcription factor [Hymenobacter aquaticus]
MKTITVLLVEDHEMVIAGLKVLLEPLPQVRVAGCVTTAAAALAFCAQQPLPDVVLLDINLPDMSGIEACRLLKAAHPDVRVLGLSTFNEKAFVVRMMQNGASGYLLKSARPAELAEALAAVCGDRRFFSEEVQNTLLHEPAPPAAAAAVPALTRREKEILGLLADGFTNQEISEKLFLSPFTVDTHRRNILLKFGVNNTAALIKLAVKSELV